MFDFVENFKNKYEKIVGKNSVEEIIKKSNDIINECIDSEGKTKNVVGIIVGKVQSGKTSNFLGIASVAFNKGFDTIFIIGGSDKTLLRQNWVRASELFDDTKDENNNITKLSKVYESDFFKDSSVITKGVDKGFFNSKKNKKIVITILKNKDHFRYILNLIKDNKDIFDERKILVIDDEGDQASLDGNYTKENEEKTKLNKQIVEITSCLKSYSFLTVTATPYANFLLDKYEMLSPKFIKLTKPGDDYAGLKTFHSSYSQDSLKNETNFIEDISDMDAKTIENLNDGDDPPESLIRAVSYFICTIVKANEEDNKLNKYEMLIHIYRNTNEQKIIKSQLDKILNEFREYSEDEKDLNYCVFINFLNKGFVILKNRKIDLSKAEDLRFSQDFRLVLEEISILLINSTRLGQKLNSDSIKDPYLIYIGSNLVQRGITISNLLVTYITRINNKDNNVDTVLQRARWFGYRKKILKYMKIFMTENLKNIFGKISIFEDMLWEELVKVDNNNISTEEFIANLFLSLPKTERPTRKNIAKFSHVKIEKWQSQRNYHETHDNERIFYKNILENSIEENYASVNVKTKEFSNWENFAKESNIDEIILNKINLQSNIFNSENKDSPKIIKVILMRYDNKNQYRKLYGNDIFQLHAAGSEKDKVFEEDIYYGDSKINNYEQNRNKILLQIYPIHFKKDNEFISDTYDLVYSLYLSDMKLEGFIRDE